MGVADVRSGATHVPEVGDVPTDSTGLNAPLTVFVSVPASIKKRATSVGVSKTPLSAGLLVPTGVGQETVITVVPFPPAALPPLGFWLPGAGPVQLVTELSVRTMW